MKYTKSCFFHPYFDDEKKSEIIQKFLDEKLPVPRETFGEEVIPAIHEFVSKYYLSYRTAIYLDGSKEKAGFEIFLDETPIQFQKTLNRIVVMFY